MKKRLLVICYPLDWHWALSFEFFRYKQHQDIDYEILDLSFAGERGFKVFLKFLLGGSILQRKCLQAWRSDKVELLDFKVNYKDIEKRTVKRVQELFGTGFKHLDETLNTISERVATLAVDPREHLPVIRDEFFKSETTKAILTQVDASRYSEITTVNGRFTKNAEVVTWAKSQNLPLTLLEFGSSGEKFEIFTTSPHSFEEIEDKINSFWTSYENKYREKIAQGYIDNLIDKKGYSSINWRSYMKPGSVVKEGARKICVFYVSTELEYFGLPNNIPKGNFKNQVEAFRGLVSLLDPNLWTIYLRMHPEMPGRNRGNEQLLWQEFKSFSHIVIVEPNSSIDSLELGELSDLAAGFGSNIAMELVARGKKNVITLGPAPWNRLLPRNFTPSLEHLSRHLKSGIPEISVSDIYPWALFMSRFGENFKVLKFDKKTSSWKF